MNTRDLAHRIASLANLVYSKEKHWKTSEMKLFPGASESEIEALAAGLPAPLPPSYREFLTITNGCLGFWARYALLGTTSSTQEPILAAIEDARSHMSEYVTGPDGSVLAERVREFEGDNSDRQLLYIPNHLVFGTNSGGEFFLFDDRHSAENVEFEVLHYTYSAGVYKTFPNFPAFLQARLEMLERRVAEKKYPIAP